MAATSARLGVNFGQQGPNFGPTTIWEQLRPKWRSMWLQNGGHSRPNPKSRFFLLSIMLHLKQCSHMFPMFFLCWAQLGAKLSPKGAKLRHVRTELGFHVHQMATIWNPSGSLWAQLQPYDHMTNWRQLGLQLGPRQRHLGPSLAPFRAARGQVGPNPGQLCGLNATRTLVFTAVSISHVFFALMGVLGARCPHTGPNCAC